MISRKKKPSEKHPDPKWLDAAAKYVLKRDGCCMKCSKNVGDLQAYHRHYHNWGRERAKDLVTLCKDCFTELYTKHPIRCPSCSNLGRVQLLSPKDGEPEDRYQCNTCKISFERDSCPFCYSSSNIKELAADGWHECCGHAFMSGETQAMVKKREETSYYRNLLIGKANKKKNPSPYLDEDPIRHDETASDYKQKWDHSIDDLDADDWEDHASSNVPEDWD
jgi:hypothetical protein